MELLLLHRLLWWFPVACLRHYSEGQSAPEEAGFANGRRSPQPSRFAPPAGAQAVALMAINNAPRRPYGRGAAGRDPPFGRRAPAQTSPE